MRRFTQDETDRIRAAFRSLEFELQQAGILDSDEAQPGEGGDLDEGPVRWVRGKCSVCGRSLGLRKNGVIGRHGGRERCAGSFELPTLIYTTGVKGRYACPRCDRGACEGPHVPERRFRNEVAVMLHWATAPDDDD